MKLTIFPRKPKDKTTPDLASVDTLLATTLAGGSASWPEVWQGQATSSQLIERVLYHGIAGLLFEQAKRLDGWPEDVHAALKQQAIAQTMWKMQHRRVLSDLVSSFAAAAMYPLFLKGSAFAYDLYATPASRARGDTDLFISQQDLPRARELLAGLGFELQSEQHQDMDVLHQQELWELVTKDGSVHDIDLHWQVMNSQALRSLFIYRECAAQPLALPRLHPEALAMNRPRALIHACLHRANHISSPYYSNGIKYFGGDRLIWAQDIHLLANALTPTEWESLCQIAISGGSAKVCQNGLEIAQTRLGTQLPAGILQRLSSAPGQTADLYLLQSRQLGRALRDLRAVPGLRLKLSFIRQNLFPSTAFLRSKYPRLHKMPVLFLHVLRLFELGKRRTETS